MLDAPLHVRRTAAAHQEAASKLQAVAPPPFKYTEIIDGMMAGRPGARNCRCRLQKAWRLITTSLGTHRGSRRCSRQRTNLQHAG